MNLADMMTLATLLGCPLAAGVVAAHERAGWFSALFVAVGILLGLACSYCVHAVSYLILTTSCRQKTWLMALLFIAYLIVPGLLALGLVLLTGCATQWLAIHIL